MLDRAPLVRARAQGSQFSSGDNDVGKIIQDIPIELNDSSRELVRGVFKEGHLVGLSRGVLSLISRRETVVRHVVQGKGITAVFSILEVHADDDVVVW